jgi:hypothetical protein
MSVWEKEYLTNGDITECLTTKEGRRELFYYLQRQRLVHGLAHVFAYLELPDPTKEQQEIICGLMWDYLYARPLTELLEDEKTARALMAQGIQPADMNILRNMETKGEA